MKKTNEEIIEGNLLIAEYMDGIYFSNLYPIGDTEIWIPYHNMCYRNKLKYHSSWDWLMPVCVKMRRLMCESEFTNRVGYDLHYTQDINKIWYNIVEYVKWYYKKNN